MKLRALLLLAMLISGGAWNRPAGEGFSAQSLRYYSTGAKFSKDVEYARASLGFYMEFGVTDWLTFVGETDQGIRLDEAGYGAQDGRIGGALQLALPSGSDSAAFAVQAGVSFPLSGFSSPAAPGGDDATGYRAALLYGRGFETDYGGAWADGLLGLIRYTEGRADEFRLDLTAGLRPDENWLVMGQMFTYMSLGDAAFGATDYDLVKAQISIGRRITETRTLLLGAARDIHARGASAGWEISLSLWTDFSLLSDQE